MEKFKERFEQYFMEECKEVSASEMAEACGITRANIYMWMDGRTVPKLDTLFKLCSKYKVSADWLLGLSEEMSLEKD